MISIPVLFRGTIPTATTKYIGLPIHRTGAGKTLGLDIGWTDAVSAATITIELTALGPNEAPVDDPGDASIWKDSGETIAGPDGTAIGSAGVYLSNVNSRRGRIKIVTTAASTFVIADGAE